MAVPVIGGLSTSAGSAAVAWFAEALRNSTHVEEDWKTIRGLAEDALGNDSYEDRRNFIDLVRRADRVGAE